MNDFEEMATQGIDALEAWHDTEGITPAFNTMLANMCAAAHIPTRQTGHERRNVK